MEKEIIKITRLETQMNQVNEKLDTLDEKSDELDRKIEKGFKDIKVELGCYVRKEEFVTVKAIVFGMVGTILTAFIGYVINLVFK